MLYIKLNVLGIFCFPFSPFRWCLDFDLENNLFLPFGMRTLEGSIVLPLQLGPFSGFYLHNERPFKTISA